MKMVEVARKLVTPSPSYAAYS